MRRTWKNFLSLLLAFAMILSLGVTGFADPETTPAEESGTVTELPFEKVDNDIISEKLPFAKEYTELEEEPLYADDEIVRVSIVLEGQSAIDAGFDPANAGAFRAGLRAEQDAMAEVISAQALGGAPLDVVRHITLAGNMISAYVPYGSIEDIKEVPGVRDVVIEIRYYPNEDVVADPENIIATQMTGATEAWNLGYTGAGSKIAIVDTGLDWDHQSFDPAAFQYAIDELNEGRETPIKLMTAEDVAAVWDQLNAAEFIGAPDGVYLNAKVPFAVNYIDRDLDVTHDNDQAGQHGSHVAGIAAANKYVSVDGEFVPALEAVETQGEAPDAQILVMKVFGKGGGAYPSDYMLAVEDAVTMGCDVVNLSLGSNVAGFTTEPEYARMLDSLTQFGLVWANSAGNNYSWSNNASGANRLYADDVNFHTGGSPATYHNTLSVASVDDTVDVLAIPLKLESGTTITFTENAEYGNAPINTIPGTYNYILLLPNENGGSNGDEDAQFGALGSEILDGKIAVAWRGNSSFFEKANAAAANGAAAVIIANNTAGAFGMLLTGYEYDIPVVSILQNDGFLLGNIGELKQANDVYYIEGTIIIPEGVATTIQSPVQAMSDFSSWGGNGALTMKPEITAPGGNIYSVFGYGWDSSANNNAGGFVGGSDQYTLMSGTSMASPQVAGLVAVLKQYIRETGLQTKLGLSDRAIAQSLLMSTSVPLIDPVTGNYWSILKQGSGLANANNAITARSLIQVVGLPDTAPESAYDSIADGKVKVELGEMMENSFSTTFLVTNLSDETVTFELNGEFFTQMVLDYNRTEYTTPISAGIGWTVDGEAYEPASLDYDFNGDGTTNGQDAQHLLNWCADDTITIYKLDKADFDEDGNVDTHDAKIAFETLNGAALELAAGKTATVTASVAFDLSEYDEINGNYIEGFLFVKEGATEDGALGVEHSIPVYGFYGNFTDAAMFDRGSYLEYACEFGDGDPEFGVVPYMYYAGLGENAFDVETFIVEYAGGGQNYFGGNPQLDDETYMPERNALNSSDVIFGARYTQIRNSGASRFYVTDENGNLVDELEKIVSAYAAYYNRGKATWENTVTTTKYGYKAVDAEEGDQFEVHFQLAPEYYVDALGEVRWDALGFGSEMSLPFVIDNTAPEIVEAARDTNIIDPDEDEVDPAPVDPEDPYDELNITIKENQYVAAVALFDDERTFLDYRGSDPEAEAGDETVYTFDLLEIFDEEVYPYLLVEVYDYANNLTTYKINFKEEGDEITSFVVDPEEATIIGTGSVQLTTDIRPWGLDESATWTSSDETVAVVDENGLVTGVSEGTAIITATSVLDPTWSATCDVTVVFIEKKLNGVVWDEEGEVWASEFNLKTLPNYTKLTEEPWRARLASLTYDPNMNMYGATLDTSSNSPKSELYAVNPADWSTELIGASSIAYMDLCQAKAIGDNYLLAVYGPYVVIVDKTTGDYEGAFDYSDDLGDAYLVGIAYYRQAKTQYGLADQFFLVDDAGNLWLTGVLPYNGSFANFTANNLVNLGFTSDWYFQSLYFDGASLYWSCFTEDNNVVDIIMVDLMGSGAIIKAGSFADGVWPVGGLFELNVNPAFPTNNVEPADDFDAVLKENSVFLTEIPDTEEIDAEIIEDGFSEDIDEPIGEIAPITGGLDFTRVDIPGEDVEKIDTTYSVEITAEELSTNGKIVVDYDPSTVTLISATPFTQYKGILDQTEEAGHYVLAWVDLEGIKADDVILTLKFAYDSNGVVTITTVEENERDPEADENLPRVEEVVLGTPGHVCPCAAFEDMPPYGTPEHEAIDWAYVNGITGGMDETHFGYGLTLTRAQTATFLYAAAGKPEFDETAAGNPFSDVPAGKWYTKAVLWAASEGLVAGYSDGTFQPNTTLTRGQIMVILYAWAGKPDVSSIQNPYSDVPAGKWYTDAALWAYDAGIERGENGVYGQATDCTREAFVLYLYRYMTGNCLAD